MGARINRLLWIWGVPLSIAAAFGAFMGGR